MDKLHVSYRIQQSNNGPTVKRAFQDHQLLAEIVNCPTFVVVGLKTMFEAFNSGHFIHVDRLKSFCKAWLSKFHSNDYQWNVMAPSVHLIWHHSPAIVEYIQSKNVTVASTSEEGAEAANKTFRYNRDHHSPQCGYEKQLKSIVVRSHNIASPQIQSLLPPPVKPFKVFSLGVEALIDRSRQPLLFPPTPPEPSANGDGEPMEVDDEDKPAV